MRFSRTVSYALHATLQLARSETGVPVPCNRLAATGALPERFLLQILRDLVNYGILRSTRGIEGGYALGRSPAEISLLDVIEAVDGPLTTALPVYQGLPEEAKSRLECALSEVNELARRGLQAVKLNHLLPAADGQTPLSRIEFGT
jgi:Rrf2 family protein